jgi:hypothetical protein
VLARHSHRGKTKKHSHHAREKFPLLRQAPCPPCTRTSARDPNHELTHEVYQTSASESSPAPPHTASGARTSTRRRIDRRPATAAPGTTLRQLPAPASRHFSLPSPIRLISLCHPRAPGRTATPHSRPSRALKSNVAVTTLARTPPRRKKNAGVTYAILHHAHNYTSTAKITLVDHSSRPGESHEPRIRASRSPQARPALSNRRCRFTHYYGPPLRRTARRLRGQTLCAASLY